MRTIEVIEDDIAMRTLFCEWLWAEGYRVCGRSSSAGLAASWKVDLVVVNLLNLPAAGQRTVRLARKLYPKAALIGISTQLGEPLSIASPLTRELGVHHLLPKPCSRMQLLATVGDVFELLDALA
jgi:CheY-like chemotaxis protein